MNKKFMLLAAGALLALFSTGCNPDETPTQETPAPELTSINPTSGYVGDDAVITGKNFSATAAENDVFFGNAKAQVKAATATSLTVVLPDNPVGKVDVKVTVGEKTAEGLSFTYLEKAPEVLPMSVTGINPTKGAVGADIVISGENFGTSADDVMVLFGEAVATVKSVTATAITVEVPEGSGQVAVIVSLGDQISDPVMFTYVFAREVTYSSMSPAIATKGDEIKIFGAGFPEATDEITVTVGDVAATVTAATAEGIIISVPELALGDHKIKVAVKGAAPFETDAFAYYYLPEYTVSTFIGNGTATNIPGVGLEASLQLPEGFAWAPDGSLWVTTRGGSGASGGHGIHKIDIATATLSKVADQSVIGNDQYPWDGAFNSKGEYHVSLKNKKSIGKLVNSEYSTYTFEGQTIDNPMSLVFDSKDVMYLSDRNNNRVVVSYGGAYTKEFKLDCRPNGIALDAKEENIFVGTNATTATDAWVIFKINIASGDISVVAGSRVKPLKDAFTLGEVGNPLSATVGNVSGLYCDENGYLYYNDNQLLTLNVLIPGVGGDYTKGVIKTIAGQGFVGGKTDGAGAEATFKAQGDLTMDKNGNFYVADGNNNLIRKVSPVK